MSDRSESSARLRQWLDDDPAADAESDDANATGDEPSSKTSVTGKKSKPSQSSKIDMPAESADAPSVKDRPSVLMYLPDELYQELDIRFDEVNAKYKRAHGDSIEKNRDWYPILVSLALEKAEELPDEELLNRLHQEEY